MADSAGTGISDSLSSQPEAKREQFRSTFLHVAPSMFLGAIDQTIIAAALPAIAGSLGGLSYLAWVVTAYLLAATVAAPLYGRMGDAFGRKRMLIWALGLFVGGSAACAIAPSLSVLVCARALQGFGGGGLMTLAQALIGEVVAPLLPDGPPNEPRHLRTPADSSHSGAGGCLHRDRSENFKVRTSSPLPATAAFF